MRRTCSPKPPRRTHPLTHPPKPPETGVWPGLRSFHKACKPASPNVPPTSPPRPPYQSFGLFDPRHHQNSHSKIKGMSMSPTHVSAGSQSFPQMPKHADMSPQAEACTAKGPLCG